MRTSTVQRIYNGDSYFFARTEHGVLEFNKHCNAVYYNPTEQSWHFIREKEAGQLMLGVVPDNEIISIETYHHDEAVKYFMSLKNENLVVEKKEEKKPTKISASNIAPYSITTKKQSKRKSTEKK